MSPLNDLHEYQLNHGLPCSLGGALAALCGVEGVAVLVNGPSSCTGFAQGMINDCHPLDQRGSIRFNRLADHGHPRVPCTEINDTDVILGIGDKVIEAVDLLDKKCSPACITIVNSCSLGLIGEDVENILRDHALSERILYLESTGCARSNARGYSEAMLCLVQKQIRAAEKAPNPCVNILGLHISQYSWKHDLREIRRLMGMAGIEVNTVLGAGSPLDEVRNLSRASLNVVVNPEYGLDIARYMKSHFGLAYVTADKMPIGFDPARQMMDGVLAFFGLEHPPALDMEEKHCRREGFLALSNSTRAERMRGMPVAVFGELAFVAGLTSFLRHYLGCWPAVLGICGRETVSDRDMEMLENCAGHEARILINPDGSRTLAALEDERPEITFGSAFEEYLLSRADFSPKFFIQTSMPGFNRTNLVHRPNLGFAGALTFIDAILNCRLTNHYPYSVRPDHD